MTRVATLSVSPSQGVIFLEPLGKKGYSIPKAGTIQVVSLVFVCGSLLFFFAPPPLSEMLTANSRLLSDLI